MSRKKKAKVSIADVIKCEACGWSGVLNDASTKVEAKERLDGVKVKVFYFTCPECGNKLTQGIEFEEGETRLDLR